MCVGSGVAATDSRVCCAGLVVINGTCQPCRTAGQTAGGLSECCTTLEYAFGYCTPDDEIRDERSDVELGRLGRRHGLVSRLERRWGATIGRAEVVACESGACALRLLATDLELETGDEVILPVGSAAAAALASAGFVPVEVDIDAKTLQLDAAAVDAAATARTRAVIAADLYGTTPDYRALDLVARRHGIVLVEDGSQSMGASFDRRPVGAMGFASICVLPGGASGAGALYAIDGMGHEDNTRRLVIVDDSPDQDLLGGSLFAPTPDDVGWGRSIADRSTASSADDCGPRPMSSLDATIAMTRIEALDGEAQVRSANGNRLRRCLDPIAGIWLPEIVSGATHTYASFPILVVPDELGLPEAVASALRDTLIDCVTAEGLWVDAAGGKPTAETHGLPVNGFPVDDFPVRDFPVRDAAIAAGLILGRNHSPLLTPHGAAEMDRVVECFAKILVDNVDRVRQLTMERAETALMI